MIKQYDVHTVTQLEQVLTSYLNHFKGKKDDDFKPLTVSFKRFRTKKTRQQHKYYWVCIGELKKALHEAGSIYTQEQVHELIKREAGFTEMKYLPSGKAIETTKSIADDSKDATLEDMRELIDFIIRFAQENLNYRIENPY